MAVSEMRVLSAKQLIQVIVSMLMVHIHSAVARTQTSAITRLRFSCRQYQVTDNQSRYSLGW